MTKEMQDFIERIREYEATHNDDDFWPEKEDDEDSAEEVQHHTYCDFACILPGVIHSNLIPWYTSGFE